MTTEREGPRDHIANALQMLRLGGTPGRFLDQPTYESIERRLRLAMAILDRTEEPPRPSG